jgi:hypothetical protein
LSGAIYLKLQFALVLVVIVKFIKRYLFNSIV